MLWFTKREAADADDAARKRLVRIVPELVAHEVQKALRQRLRIITLGVAAPLLEKRKQTQKNTTQVDIML